MSGTSMDGIDASFVKSNGITLERLMKRGFNLPFNLLVGSEAFYSTDMAGAGNPSGWAAVGVRLDYGF